MNDNISNNGSVNEVYAFPASYAQQRLWFLHRLEPDSPAYNIPAAFRLSGPVDVGALERSFQEIVRRHEALRTTFSLLDGEPRQIIAPTGPAMSTVDLRPLREPERESELRRRVGEETKRCFDLDKGPLFRVSLLQIDDEESVLILNMHHIISDGWSTSILFREIASCYEAFSENINLTLPELPIQYADYAVWQRDPLQEATFVAQLSYWKDHLRHVPALKLPTDRPRPVVQSCRGARHSVSLSAAAGDRLKSLSRQEGVTLFMTVLAAFQAFLYRLTGHDDISVGTPIAGRTRPETEGLIGFFVNTLVLRTDLSGEPTFRELLARVRKVALDAYDHQDLPFEKLVQELNPDRSLSQNPLFQVMFTFNNASESVLRLRGTKVTRFEMSSGVTKFDLSAHVTEKNNALSISFLYNTDLFDDATIHRWLSHLQLFCEAIAADPDQRLTQLAFLSDAEKHRLLIEWNDTKMEYPRDSTIHYLFEAQVKRTPEAVAVICDDQQITYAELNRRANQLAGHLRDAGLNRNGLVGICVERSLEMIVGLLAILKAGGVYVPLDPSYPQERLSFMLEDSRAAVLITQERLLSRLPKLNARIVCLDRDESQLSRQSESNQDVEISAEDLAYVIYTSGSTGVPKGVAVSHRAVNRLVMNTDYVELGPADVIAQASNISFDAATFEIWGALLNGSRLALIGKDTLLSPQAMATAIEQHGMTTLFLTTALFNQMAEQIPVALGKLHHLLFGGEAVDPRRVRELLQKSPPKRLVHVYGPTETTTFACWYLVKGVAGEASTVPIGRPIANTKIYILDTRLSPVAIGVVGELYISGDGLAAGYLNSPELNHAKFVEDPFSNTPSGRLYKTGDLARYLADGNIEFVGRIDEQVKIRGFRIEPGEIESVLSKHPGIRDCVVIARQDDPDERNLAAYVVAAKDAQVTAHDLRMFLEHKLPNHMIPAAFAFLAELPLTPNGKIDRQALPARDPQRREERTEYIAPRTAVEQVLAEIWAEVLKVERVSIHDNFFDLGGHSLMGIRLIAQVCKELQIELPLRRLFECPTVAALADRVSSDLARAAADRRANSRWRYLFELKPGAGQQPVFFLPGGFGGDHEFLVYARLTHFVGDDFTFYGLRARSADGVELAHSSAEEMAADYIQEMRILQPQGPYFIVGNCIGGIVAYEIAQQLRSLGQEVALLALMDSWCPTPERFRRYRKNLSKTRLRRRAHHVLEVLRNNYYLARLPFHWQRFWEMDWRRRLPYLLRKTGAALTDSARTCSKPSASSDHFASPNEMKRTQIQEGYIEALQRYRARPYFGRAVMLVNEKNSYRDPTLGWSDLVVGGIDVRKIPGDHEAYIRQYVETAAAELRDCLRCALAAKRARESDEASDLPTRVAECAD